MRIDVTLRNINSEDMKRIDVFLKYLKEREQEESDPKE